MFVDTAWHWNGLFSADVPLRNCSLTCWHCSYSVLSRVFEMVEHPSVSLSVCPIVWPQPWWVCLLSAMQAGDVDRQPSSSAAARRSIGNSSSVTLTANVGSWTHRLVWHHITVSVELHVSHCGFLWWTTVTCLLCRLWISTSESTSPVSQHRRHGNCCLATSTRWHALAYAS